VSLYIKQLPLKGKILKSMHWCAGPSHRQLALGRCMHQGSNPYTRLVWS